MPSAISGLMFAAVVATGSSAVPVYIWSNSAREGSSRERREQLDSAQFANLVKDAVYPIAGSVGSVNVFTFDDLHSTDVAPLAAAQARAGTGGLSLLAQTIGNAPFSMSVKDALITSDDLSKAVESISLGCKITTIAAEESSRQAGEISREEYQGLVGSKASGCNAFIVSLRRNSLDEELAFVIRSVGRAAKAGNMLALLTAEPATSTPRMLGAVAPVVVPAAFAAITSSNSTGINISPPIVEGLVLSLVMLFFLAVGLSCVMGIQTPDLLFTTNMAMPAGKEY